MNLFCIKTFKDRIEKLRKKNSYSDLEPEIIQHFFDKTVSQLREGDLLNKSEIACYIKKRLSGKGGYRIYFLLLIHKDCLYLMYVNPKTGPLGSENISNDFQKELWDQVTKSIKENKYYKVNCNTKRNRIVFEKMPDIPG